MASKLIIQSGTAIPGMFTEGWSSPMSGSMNGNAPERVSIAILTGFLGSGKTTLLNRLLKSPEAAESAVIVNEFGEIGLDHFLLEKIDGETVLLDSGCVCCTVKNDLVETIAKLLARRRAGEVPRFRRIVLETTGLADPAPIIHVLMTEPTIAGHTRVDSVVCTADAVNGLATLGRHHESERQAAMADRIVLTKTDIADAGEARRLEEALHRLNPAAPILRAADDKLAVAELLYAGLYDPATKNADVARWLGMQGGAQDAGWHDAHDPADPHDHAGHDHHDHHGEHGDDGEHGGPHHSSIRTFHVILERPLTWAQLSEWLGTLNERRGDALLRVKGILNVEGQAGPVVVHGVQQLIHIPTVLPEWPDAERRSRIVFITDGLEAAVLKKDLEDILPKR